MVIQSIRGARRQDVMSKPFVRGLNSCVARVILAFFLMLAAARAQSPRPWWDNYPLMVESGDVNTVIGYHGDCGFDTSLTDTHWGIYMQKTIGNTQTVANMHKANLKFLGYYTTSSWASFILELGDRGNLDYSPVYRFFWSWNMRDTQGGPFRWCGPQNYFDTDDFCGPYTRLHPVYGAGGRSMTYPDGSSATGYLDNDFTDPRKSRVLDAGSSKDIFGNFFMDYGYVDGVADNPLRSGGLLMVTQNGQNRLAGYIWGGVDMACPMWNDMAHSSALYGTNYGLDGIWSDNYGPWCTFGYPPLGVAFGDWSMAGFRDYLGGHFSASELTEMGVADAATFDVRAYLRGRCLALGGTDTKLNDPKWNDASWLNDPVWNAFKIYKRQMGTQSLSDYYQACKSAAVQMGKPDFFVSGNDIPFYALGYSRGTLDQVHTEMLPGWHMGAGSRGIMMPPVGRFAPVYKLAREHAQGRFVNVTFYLDDQFLPNNMFNKYKEKMGAISTLYYEMLANNALPMLHLNVGYAPRTTQSWAINDPFFAFVKEARKIFGNREAVEEVGVYYSSSSLLAFMTPVGFLDMDHQPHQFAVYGWGTALGELHSQYRIIPEWKLTSDTLKSLRVLIIPQAEALDRSDVTGVLEPWVRAGGLMIVTGNSGARKGEAGNFDVDPGGLSLAGLTGVASMTGAPVSQLQAVGTGKVLFIRDNIGMTFYNYSTQAQRSSYLAPFKQAMDDILVGQPPVVLTSENAPGTVGLTLYEDGGNRRLFIDANNLNVDLASDAVQMTPAISFRVQLPDWLKGLKAEEIRVRVLSPDDPTPTASLSLVGEDRAQVALGAVRALQMELV